MRLGFILDRDGTLTVLTMAAEMVKSATSDKLIDMDWTKSIEICELVAKDHVQAKDVVKCLKKRLGHKNVSTQFFTVRLLEMLMNNCGEHFHRLVIDNGLLPILVKIVKKKTNLSVRERIFLLLDATQMSLGGAEGRFPQYYTAYYDLVASRVQFSQRSHIQSTQPCQAKEINEHSNDLSAEVSQSNRCQGAAKEISSETVHSIIQKATSVKEVLGETLNALAPRCREGAPDEFILDLVEQCSFQKQRVMHLVMTCHDEKVIAQAIELNELLDEVLTKHDSLLSFGASSTTCLFVHDEAKEDEEGRLRRTCKGKALAKDNLEILGSSLGHFSDGELGRPFVRTLNIQRNHEDNNRPRLPHHPVGSIPPPPAKHMERKRFFREKNLDGPNHNRTGSSSRSGSTDFSDPGSFHE